MTYGLNHSSLFFNSKQNELSVSVNWYLFYVQCADVDVRKVSAIEIRHFTFFYRYLSLLLSLSLSIHLGAGSRVPKLYIFLMGRSMRWCFDTKTQQSPYPGGHSHIWTADTRNTTWEPWFNSMMWTTFMWLWLLCCPHVYCQMHGQSYFFISLSFTALVPFYLLPHYLSDFI